MNPKKNRNSKPIKNIRLNPGRKVYRMNMSENGKWVEYCGLGIEDGEYYILQKFIQQYRNDNTNKQHDCGGHPH